MEGVNISAMLDFTGADAESLAFKADITDFGTAVDVAFWFTVDGEIHRGQLTTLPKSAVVKLVDALTPITEKI